MTGKSPGFKTRSGFWQKGHRKLHPPRKMVDDIYPGKSFGANFSNPLIAANFEAPEECLSLF